MNNIILAYFTELLAQWQFDINFIEGRHWMIYTVIPALGYLVFFMLKWAALTAPLWLPISLAFGRSSIITINKGK